MGELFCVFPRGNASTLSNRVTALGQISALNSLLHVVQSISSKPTFIFWA